MIGKGLAIIALGSLVSIGFSQALTAAESEVDQAFKLLRGESDVLLRLAGNEYVGSTTTAFASDFFWSRPALSIAQDMKMELLEGRNGLWTHRVVGDGRHVWGIDLSKNTYSTARYGAYTATKPADYEQNGLQSLNVYATGQSSLVARLAREVWGGFDALYRSWIPASSNRSETSVQGAGSTFSDPVVTTRQYVSSDTKKFHVYWTTKAGTPVRSIAFELNEISGNWRLGAIYYSDLARFGATTKLTDWRTDVYTTPLPTAGTFTYTPPAGARAVAGPRPNSGG